MPTLNPPGFRRRPNEIIRERTITFLCQLLGLAFDLPRFIMRRPPSTLNDIDLNSKVLLIKPCCLGDVLLSTAAVRALALARPDLKLDYLVSNWSRVAVAGNPRLHNLVATGVDGSRLGWRDYLRLARQLRRQKYAAALVFDRSPILNLLPWLAGIAVRAGVDNQHRGFALNVRATQPLQVQHEAEVYLDVVRAFGVVTLENRLEYIPTGQAQNSLLQKISWLANYSTGKLAVIHPGGGQNPDTQVLSKRWSAEKFGTIAARLLIEGYRVVIIGADSDLPLAEKVLQVAKQHLNQFATQPELARELYNIASQLDLTETATLLQRAQLFVGNDTGVMHLATTGDAAVVSIFGPSSPVAYAPYTPHGVAVSAALQNVPAGLPLREYQQLNVAAGGIEAVTSEMVWQAILEVTSKGKV